MINQPQSLLFDIDVGQLERFRLLMDATEKEMLAAYNRAIARTAVTMKTLSGRLLRDGLGAKNLKTLRKRMQAHRSQFQLSKSNNSMDELKLWYGLNDVAISRLKGRVRQQYPAGSVFRSKQLGRHAFFDGFVANLYQKRSIFARKGESRFPVAEGKVPVSDDLHVQLEDEVLDSLPDVFMRHFKTDLKGRVAGRDIINSR